MHKAKSSGIVKFMNVMSVIMFVIFIYMVIVNIIYLRTYAASYAMTIGDMWNEMLQYMISGSIEYFVYGSLFLAAGKIMNMLRVCCQGAELQKVNPATVNDAALSEQKQCNCDNHGSDKEDKEPESEPNTAEEDEAESKSEADAGKVIEINVSEDATEETKAINVAEIRQRKRKKKK